MRSTYSLPSLLLSAFAVATLASSTTSAQTVDITHSGSSATIGGAAFYETDQQPAGTGFIDPFLRVQASPTEQGYNTDGGFPFNDKNPHNFQHSVLLSSLGAFTLNGTAYFKFMLDANQSGQSGHDFTLTQLQVYTSNDGSQMTTAFNPDGTLPLGNLAYDMNPGGGTSHSVITHATGSGAYDAVIFIPVSDFNLSDKYVTLYFAGQGNGGFEEWTAATGVSPVPEPSAVALVLSAFPIAGMALLRRRQSSR
jgi:hypothetical protein